MFQLGHDQSMQPAHLSLSGSLTIYEVREAHAALLQVLGEANQPAWLMDLGELDELDSAGAQLLLAVQRHLTQSGASLEVCNAGGQVLELLEMLRLQALYPSVLPANR